MIKRSRIKIGTGMRIYVAKTDDSEEKFFLSLKKARKCGGDIRTINIDIDGPPHEGCTRKDFEWWADDLGSWLID